MAGGRWSEQTRPTIDLSRCESFAQRSSATDLSELNMSLWFTYKSGGQRKTVVIPTSVLFLLMMVATLVAAVIAAFVRAHFLR